MAAEDDGEQRVEYAEEEVCPEGAPEWVVTFGDMMSLLLTFFILLLSFATMDVMRFKELAGTIKQGFGLKVIEKTVVVPKAQSLIRLQPKIDFNARQIMERLRRKLDPSSPTRRTAKVTIELFQVYQGVVVLFPADEIFEPGTDRIRPAARPLILTVAGELREQNALRAAEPEALPPLELSVEVRSPEGAPRAALFADVWSLTAAQAVAVARLLRSEGEVPAGEVRAIGRGPAPPTPRPGTLTPPATGSTVEFIFVSQPMKPKD
ncbi:MAG: hypothetical protein KC620_07190 [Myxococcales bacterium]|nr:hypothetical protein [Myxococcales bacterium]